MRDPGVAAVLSAIIRVACSAGSATSSQPTRPTRTRGIIAGDPGNDRTPGHLVSSSVSGSSTRCRQKRLPGDQVCDYWPLGSERAGIAIPALSKTAE
jgi:hypothetical protein